MSLPNGVVKPGGADLVVSRQDSQGTASHRPNIGLNRASPSRGSASGWPSETANQFAALKAEKRDTSRVVYRCPGTGRPYLIVQKAD
jgi:hypothetical protein